MKRFGRKAIFFTFPIGQSIRDHLHLGTLRILRDLLPGVEIIGLSPSHFDERFRRWCSEVGVIPQKKLNPVSAGINARLVRLRKRMRSATLRRWMVRWEARRYVLPTYLKELFETHRPRLVVLTHPMTTHDYEVYMGAQQYGVPTLGIVNSWDNLRKGLIQWADCISVWNRINYEEALRMNAYAAHQVRINGPVSFDPFFDPEWEDTREETARKLGLDPSRKWITYATSGVFHMGYYGRDETWLVHEIMQWRSEQSALRDAQLLVRLHPMSKLEYFIPLKRRYPDVVFSYGGYLPGTGWLIDREDYRTQVNILRHSDVVITPGSSWAIEAAVMDTPVVVPVYSPNQPEHAQEQFDNFTLAAHFRPIVQAGWVPVTRSSEATLEALLQAVEAPEETRSGRAALAEAYVPFRDGKSAERVARWICEHYKESR